MFVEDLEIATFIFIYIYIYRIDTQCVCVCIHPLKLWVVEGVKVMPLHWRKSHFQVQYASLNID